MLRPTWRSALLLAGESALIFGAIVAASYVRLGADAWVLLGNPGGLLRAGLVLAVCQTTLHYADLYNVRFVTDVRELLIRLLQAVGFTSILLALIYFWFQNAMIGRGVFLVAAVFIIISVVAWRLLFAWVSRRAAPRERLLLVGTSAAAVELARELYERRQELGVEIVGFVDPDPARVGAAVINPGVVGSIDDITSLVSSMSVDRVVVSLSDARGKLPMDRLLDMRLRAGVTFDHLTDVYEQYTGKIAVENLRPSWLIFSTGFRKTRSLLAVKRAMDIVGSLVGLLLALPIMAVVALAVRLSSPGAILYEQQRVGLNGRVFRIHKFRSMRADAEAATGAVWSTANDTRVTRVGRFIRLTRLDELPQLWNVLRGDMSLVGPRPERPEFVSQLTDEIPFYGQRHVVKPGLTGWAQIRYTYGASVEDTIEKLQYDLYYIKNMSVALDAVIAIETLKIIILRRGAR
jgi:sugar transferase (PEP-CTERM system associated)